MYDHSDIESLLCAYALGAVNEDERTAITAHITNCQSCQQQLQHLHTASGQLSIDVPQLHPSSALKERIMHEVRTEAELFKAARTTPTPRRRRPSLQFALPALALAAVIAVIIVISGGQGSVIVKPSNTAIQATLRINGSSAKLVADDIPAPNANHIYEVWLENAQGTISPANILFTVHDQRADISIPNLHGATQVLITREPAGGSPQPTTAPLLMFSV
jgi:anti-sigma factor RsiW